MRLVTHGNFLVEQREIAARQKWHEKRLAAVKGVLKTNDNHGDLAVARTRARHAREFEKREREAQVAAQNNQLVDQIGKILATDTYEEQMQQWNEEHYERLRLLSHYPVPVKKPAARKHHHHQSHRSSVASVNTHSQAPLIELPSLPALPNSKSAAALPMPVAQSRHQQHVQFASVSPVAAPSTSVKFSPIPVLTKSQSQPVVGSKPVLPPVPAAVSASAAVSPAASASVSGPAADAVARHQMMHAEMVRSGALSVALNQLQSVSVAGLAPLVATPLRPRLDVVGGHALTPGPMPPPRPTYVQPSLFSPARKSMMLLGVPSDARPYEQEEEEPVPLLQLPVDRRKRTVPPPLGDTTSRSDGSEAPAAMHEPLGPGASSPDPEYEADYSEMSESDVNTEPHDTAGVVTPASAVQSHIQFLADTLEDDGSAYSDDWT